MHLAEAGIHSSEAVTWYKKSLDHSTWHEFHLEKRTSASDKETIIAAEASGDDVSNLIGQKLAIVALSFSHCQPLNNIPRIKFGWYDRPKSTGVAVRAICLIGYSCTPNCLTQPPRPSVRPTPWTCHSHEMGAIGDHHQRIFVLRTALVIPWLGLRHPHEVSLQRSG